MYPSGDLSAAALSALVDASAAINSARGLDETLSAITRAAAAVMNAEQASIIMLDRIRGKQVFKAAVGDMAKRLVGVEYDAGVGISGKVLASGQAVIVNDVSRDKAHYKEIDELTARTTRSLIAAPLIHKGGKLGVVEVLNPLGSPRFGETDLELCRIFANLAAIAAANAELHDRLERENRGLRQVLRGDGLMVGDSPPMRKVKDLIARVAPTTSTVLLLGETGTGKELAARMVHASSGRAERPFIPVNCAALPESLMESELFGHEAGAFTGAAAKKLGRFELASGGTIFLDEIAEAPPEIQVKLLRVLEDREIMPLGGVRVVATDVRVIAASNRDLAAEMKAGRFRDDLFYRLNVFPVTLPPLRERRGDIPILVEHFVRELAGELKMAPPAVAPEAMAALARHDFPGNVRELQNVLERACLLCLGPEGPTRIGLEHLPGELVSPPAPPAAGESALAQAERAAVLDALHASDWNQTRAAKALGISRDNLRYRIKKYGLSRPGD